MPSFGKGLLRMSERLDSREPAGRRGALAVGGVFAALLAAAMFFSGTIYTYDLPRVTASSPGNGYLNKRETTSGYADWESVGKINSNIAGKIAEVRVSKGDRVTAGQVLFIMSYDRAESERKLLEIENSLEKLDLDIQGIYLKMERYKRNLSDYAASQAEARRQYEKAATKQTTGNDLALTDLNIRKAEQSLTDAKILYEAGAATLREVATAQDNLETLYIQRESTVRSIEEQREKDADNLETLYRNISSYDKSITDAKADMEQLELDLISREHDKKSYGMQKEPYLSALADYDDNLEIISDVSGIALTVPVEKGQNIGENTLMATVGVGNAYIVTCTIPIDNNFVFPGGAAVLSNTARVLEGEIISIEPGEHGKDLEVRVISDDIYAGETFDITFSNRSEIRYTLVPNGALNRDNDGYYVKQIKKRSGLLGDEYYLERLDVYIGDSDSQNTVITGGVRFFEPIMLTSDKPAAPGDAVTLTNEEEFFAN